MSIKTLSLHHFFTLNLNKVIEKTSTKDLPQQVEEALKLENLKASIKTCIAIESAFKLFRYRCITEQTFHDELDAISQNHLEERQIIKDKLDV